MKSVKPPISTYGGMSILHDAVRGLEKKRDSKIWCMLHCKSGHMCYPTMWSILENLDDLRPGNRVELLIHSGGGHPDIAYRVMKFLRGRFQEVNVIVPLYAKSAATLLCLGADRIYLGELADLGPIDIQIADPVEHGRKSFSPLDEFKSLEFLREQAIEWMDYYAAVMSRKYGLSIKEALKDSVPLVAAVMRPVFEQIDPVEMGGYRPEDRLHRTRAAVLHLDHHGDRLVDHPVYDRRLFYPKEPQQIPDPNSEKLEPAAHLSHGFHPGHPDQPGELLRELGDHGRPFCRLSRGSLLLPYENLGAQCPALAYRSLYFSHELFYLNPAPPCRPPAPQTTRNPVAQVTSP